MSKQLKDHIISYKGRFQVGNENELQVFEPTFGICFSMEGEKLNVFRLRLTENDAEQMINKTSWTTTLVSMAFISQLRRALDEERKESTVISFNTHLLALAEGYLED